MNRKDNERFLNLSERLAKLGFVFYTHDKNNIFTYVNDAVTEVFGYTKEEFLDDYTKLLTDSEVNMQATEYTQMLFDGKHVDPYELEIFHKSGDILSIEVYEVPLYDDNGKVIAVEGIAKDITQIRQLEKCLMAVNQELTHQQNFLSESQRLAHIGSWEYYIETGNLIWSDETFRIFGFEPQSFKPNIEKFYSLIPEDDAQLVSQAVEKSMRKEVETYEISHVINNGKSVLERGRVIFEDNTPVSMIGTVQDITEQQIFSQQIKNQEEKLRYQEHHDPLTGLHNRQMFIEQLDSYIRFAKRNNSGIAILFIDVDRFKEINDSLGHDIGDEIIVNLSERIQQSIRGEDYVYRLGGDEFAVIMYDVKTPQIAANVAEKILRIIAGSIHVDSQELYVTSSIGISVYPQDGTDSKALIKNADAAMYKAKDQGRNTFEFYTHEMTEIAFERVLMKVNIRRAIQKDEFILFYQPQFLCSTHKNKLIGFEALIRWKHPDLGMISPGKFIPIAEESDFIIEIGDIVFRKACLQVVEWYSQGYNPGKVAVNLSGKQILDINLIPKVKSILDETHCNPAWIELEVTEGFIMQNIEVAETNLYELKALGIQLSIDDFGTGYSSLAYLKKLPISKLKIDQSFVRDIHKDDDDKAIVTAIIALSKSLNLLTLAEGIETSEQKSFLRDEGCDAAQGYYFSRPIPVEDVEKLLIEFKKELH